MRTLLPSLIQRLEGVTTRSDISNVVTDVLPEAFGAAASVVVWFDQLGNQADMAVSGLPSSVAEDYERYAGLCDEVRQAAITRKTCIDCLQLYTAGSVACHELTHYVQAEQIAGLPWLVNAALGQALTPQVGLDRWFSEGLAVYYETASKTIAPTTQTRPCRSPGWPGPSSRWLTWGSKRRRTRGFVGPFSPPPAPRSTHAHFLPTIFPSPISPPAYRSSCPCRCSCDTRSP